MMMLMIVNVIIMDDSLKEWLMFMMFFLYCCFCSL